MKSLTLAVDGMTCQSCEILIESRLRKISGVSGVKADAAKNRATVRYDGAEPSLDLMNEAVAAHGYRFRPFDAPAAPLQYKTRPTARQIVSAFAAALLLGYFVSRAGWLGSGIEGSDQALSFWSVFMIGLVAAVSSCLATTGGLMLSTVKSRNDAVVFVAARVLSYALFGGLIGRIGQAFFPSATALGILTILAAAYMLVAGLDMLNLAPAWLKGLLPKMPKWVAGGAVEAGGQNSLLRSGLVGAVTFFVPCGFTQSLQIFALTTGTFSAGAMTMLAFALGTAPALLFAGFLSGSMRGDAGRTFARYAGALIVVMGLWNVQNGLTMTGNPISFPTPSVRSQASSVAADPNVSLEGGMQVIRMRLANTPSYLPSDTYTVKAGTPVRMEVNGIGTGCRGILQIPKLRISKALNQQVNIIEFIPSKPGQYVFSCSMGMFPGRLNVI